MTLEHDVEALCRFPTRTVGTPGHLAARRHLLDRFAELGLAPYSAAKFELPYGPLELDLANVVGVAAGTDAALPPLLIGAHYDTAPARRPGGYPPGQRVRVNVTLATGTTPAMETVPTSRSPAKLPSNARTLEPLRSSR